MDQSTLDCIEQFVTDSIILKWNKKIEICGFLKNILLLMKLVLHRIILSCELDVYLLSWH